MDSDIFRLVKFDKYCETCTHYRKEEWEDPCNDCLAEGMNEESAKPVYYEEATAEELRKRKKNGT